MSDYPPPTSNVTIFNPENFTSTILGVSSGSIGSPGSLNFPYAQGAETFTNGTDTLVLDNGLATFSTIQSFVQSGVGLNAIGFAYNNGATTDTITWSNLVTKVQAIGAITATSTPVSPPAQSTTLNVNDTIQIQNGETATLPHTFISLSADSNNLRMNLCQNGTTNQYGTAGQVLTSGGSAGSMSWGSGGGGSVGTLNDVLINGDTTTGNATFNFAPTSTSMTIGGAGLAHTNPSLGYILLNDRLFLSNFASTIEATLTQTGLLFEDIGAGDYSEVQKNLIEVYNQSNNCLIRLDTLTSSPFLSVSNDFSGFSVALAPASLGFTSGTFPSISTVGIQKTGTGLQLNTNGTLTLDGLGGSAGQVLSYSSGNAVWATPAIRSGVIALSTTVTTGAVTFGTPLASTEEPAITFGMITGANTIFVNIGVVSVTGVAGAWTGFNWRSTATATTVDVQRAYWIAVPLNL
jgi:hypothetical protein